MLCLLDAEKPDTAVGSEKEPEIHSAETYEASSVCIDILNSSSRTNESLNSSDRYVPQEGTPIPSRLCSQIDSNGSSSTSDSHTERPSLEAFRQGIQPYRPFENLASSVGAYKRVLKTLHQAKTTLKSKRKAVPKKSDGEYFKKKSSEVLQLSVDYPKTTSAAEKEEGEVEADDSDYELCDMVMESEDEGDSRNNADNSQPYSEHLCDTSPTQPYLNTQKRDSHFGSPISYQRAIDAQRLHWSQQSAYYHLPNQKGHYQTASKWPRYH
ncbi:unnamed protein product [Protopolystoma xenopodis]|uniref:Uncharacterized protein n=1 Tax=Protopolystoma xenopodis TaxID=117903 RepID=A0A3S5CPX4_9PLAT|nr:unnamed protein product [Protopolystoma xenopodis]